VLTKYELQLPKAVSVIFIIVLVYNKLGPHVVVEWLTLLLYIREVPVSNLVLETGYPH
jgi:predicted O-linked N-acetylglucosamine transferase (SPINDLY family)